MKDNIEHLEKYRVRSGNMESSPGDGPNGTFLVPHHRYKKDRLQVIVSDGLGWEHVSATYFKKNKTPTWDDMCYVKDLFWGAEEIVYQLHPPESTYVNNHPHVLHLWRPTEKEIPIPPTLLVGVLAAVPEDIDAT